MKNLSHLTSLPHFPLTFPPFLPAPHSPHGLLLNPGKLVIILNRLSYLLPILHMDSLHITRIRAYGYHGALPEENVLGQWFEVDLILWLDLTKAGQSDRLEDTVNYGNVVSTVQHLVKTARFALIERLASAIAEAILQEYPIVKVQVRLTKVTPPIPEFDGTVTIEITRNQ
jgi:7,8-dihydroneopterin aldolase/epimerase/oxygenase